MASRNRGKNKLSLRDFSRLHATPDEETQIWDSLPRLPAIAIAVLGAAMVEQTLEKLLRYRLSLKDEETWKEITEDNGPLRSFHTKILMAHAMGIFDATARDNSQVVRRIRNAFAHAKKPLDFSNELITKELTKVRSSPKAKKKVVYKEITQQTYGPRESYSLLCLILSNLLLSKLARYWSDKTRRRTRRVSKPSILANVLLGQLKPKARATLAGGWLGLQDHQSAGPNSEADAKSPDTHPRKPRGKPRMRGK